MKFDEAPRLTQRLQLVAEAKEQFWAKWMRQVFSVYLAEAENDDTTYRLGVVEE